MELLGLCLNREEGEDVGRNKVVNLRFLYFFKTTLGSLILVVRTWCDFEFYIYLFVGKKKNAATRFTSTYVAAESDSAVGKSNQDVNFCKYFQGERNVHAENVDTFGLQGDE